MSENTPETPAPTQEPEKAPEQTPAAETPKSFTQDEVNAMLAEQKRKGQERFADYSELKARADKLAEIEESQKSEQQRHADAAAQAQRERDDARTESLRYKAAATHGVNQDYFDMLGSGDEDAINSRGERLGSLLKERDLLKAELEALKAGKPAPTNGRPVEALKPGATPEHAQTEDDVLYNSLFGG